jgi:hypothetical protein
MTQRLYLVKRGDVEGEGTSQGPACTFVVLGSTGNIYEVQIKRMPSCTCPDHAKGNLCKHILFVMLKVIKLPRTSNLIYQEAFLTAELVDIFASMSNRIAVLAPQVVRTEYARLTGSTDDEIDRGMGDWSVKQKPLGDADDCAICFDTMSASDEITFCKGACGMNFHADCIQRWTKQLLSSRQPVTCPACRQEWVHNNDSESLSTSSMSMSASVDSAAEGYANLAHISGHSLDRDTSTYSEQGGSFSRRGYRGRGSWRRGGRW